MKGHREYLLLSEDQVAYSSRYAWVLSRGRENRDIDIVVSELEEFKFAIKFASLSSLASLFLAFRTRDLAAGDLTAVAIVELDVLVDDAEIAR